MQLHWPRQVGKNSRRKVHGKGPNTGVVIVATDEGARGWGTGRGVAEDFEALVGRRVGELIDPATGIAEGCPAFLDFALHDLAGVILDKPVYALLGGSEPVATPCYSGMIYFDDLEPPESPAGIDVVLKNCQQDVDLGYRQLKVKIGRGNQWMSKAAGTRRDAEVVRAIADAFPEVEILVDGNDGFTPEEMIDFLEQIGDVELFWIEEPFRESREGYRILRDWLKANGRGTLLADGEAQPDHELLFELMDEGLLDVYLPDISGYGFTPWRKIMPVLKKKGALTSPHAWGTLLKTHYISHLAAALGNVVTIEGVTCSSEEVDFGDYKLEGGKLAPSSAPGFGMTL